MQGKLQIFSDTGKLIQTITIGKILTLLPDSYSRYLKGIRKYKLEYLSRDLINLKEEWKDV